MSKRRSKSDSKMGRKNAVVYVISGKKPSIDLLCGFLHLKRSYHHHILVKLCIPKYSKYSISFCLHYVGCVIFFYKLIARTQLTSIR